MFSRGMGEQEGWEPRLVMLVNRELEELALNARDHGCVEGRRFDVALSSEHEAVGIEFTDDGVAFDPLVEAPEPEVSSGAEMHSLGRLGLTSSCVWSTRFSTTTGVAGTAWSCPSARASRPAFPSPLWLGAVRLGGFPEVLDSLR